MSDRLASEVLLEGAALRLGQRVARTAVGPFEVHFFRDPTRAASAMAIARGDLTDPAPMLARVHSSCVTSECLMAKDCDCVDQLGGALTRIAEAGRGVVFYLIQEGRGAGLMAKARDRMMVQASGHRMTTFEAYAEMGLPPDLRRYDVLGPMVRALGLRAPIELLSNNPVKIEAVARVLAEQKIDVASAAPIEGRTSAFNQDYLRAKRRSGHALSGSAKTTSSLPPVAVQVEPPLRAANHPALISAAHYQLPVDLVERTLGAAPRSAPETSSQRKAQVDWFDVRVVYDERSGRASVLLSFGTPLAPRTPLRPRTPRTPPAPRTDPPEVFFLGLMDRLPCAEATGREALRNAMCGVRGRGQGQIVVVLDEAAPWVHLTSPGPAREAALALAHEIGAADWGAGTRDAELPAFRLR